MSSQLVLILVQLKRLAAKTLVINIGIATVFLPNFLKESIRHTFLPPKFFTIQHLKTALYINKLHN